MKVKAVLIVAMAVLAGGCSTHELNYLFSSYLHGRCLADDPHCTKTPAQNPRTPAPPLPTAGRPGQS